MGSRSVNWLPWRNSTLSLAIWENAPGSMFLMVLWLKLRSCRWNNIPNESVCSSVKVLLDKSRLIVFLSKALGTKVKPLCWQFIIMVLCMHLHIFGQIILVTSLQRNISSMERNSHDSDCKTVDILMMMRKKWCGLFVVTVFCHRLQLGIPPCVAGDSRYDTSLQEQLPPVPEFWLLISQHVWREHRMQLFSWSVTSG